MPKKNKKTKNNSIYNPAYKEGYEILNRISDFERAGNAMQSHDLDVSRKIDSAAARWRRQNAEELEELEWERKKEDDRRATEKRMSETPLPSVMGGQNALGAAMYGIGAAYNRVKNKEVPNQPDDYGLSDFLKDQWNSFFGEMNNLQAKDAQGYQFRAENDKRLINSYMKSLDELDEIEAIDVRINQIRQINRNDLNVKQLQNLNQELDSLIARRNQLKSSYDSKATDRKQLEDMTSQNVFGAAWDSIVAGNQYFGKGGLTGVFGKTTAAHDELNDARRFLYNLSDPKLSISEKRRKLNTALKEYDALNEGWNAIIEENNKDAEEYKNKVSAWYKAREQKAGTDFFDLDTYLFKMPGIMGGSSSSYMKQIPAMIAGLAGGVAATAMSGGASLIPLAAGGLSSFGLQRAAGISENNAEVAEHAIERVKNKTGLSEKDISDIISGKLTDPAKLRKITENIKTVENLFDTDMAATTWDAAVDATLNTVPIGHLAKLGKFARDAKAFKKVLENPLIRRAVESRFGQDFVRGYRAFDAAGPTVGVLGGVANSTVGRGTKEASKALGNFIVRKTDGTKAGELFNAVQKRLSSLGKATARFNPAEFSEKSALINGTRVKYAKGIGGRLIKSGISEGIEEGKQYLNAEAFKDDTIDSKYMNVFDIGLTDMVNGLTSGAYMLGIPLDGLGLIDIKDRNILAEIKGGMIGGWGHTAMINTIENAVPYIREKRADELVLENVYSDKLASQYDLKQFKNWLGKGLFKPGYGEVLNSIDRLREINNNRKDETGSYGIDPTIIDQTEKQYKRVISIAQDPITRMEAEAAGIKTRTATNPNYWKSNKEYHEFVAAKAVAMNKLEEVAENRNQASSDVRQAETNLEQNLLNSRILSTLQSGTEDSGLAASRLGEENELRRELGVGPQMSEVQQSMAFDNAEAYNDAAITKNTAFLAALLKYREELETALEAQKDNKHARVRRGLKDQIKHLNSMIDQAKEAAKNYTFGDVEINTLADVEDHLAYNLEEHEQLRDAYENQIKWNYEYQSAVQAYENLVGKHKRIDEEGNAKDLTDEDADWNPREDLNHLFVEKGNSKQILDSIHKMEKDDDDFESMIEKVYQEDLKAEHLNERNGWVNPEINPAKYRAVNDANGNQVQVQFDEQGVPNRELAENEFMTRDGRVWEQIDYGRKDPFKEALKPRISQDELDQSIRRSFAETWQKQTGTPLPMTPEGFIEQHKLMKAMGQTVVEPTAPSVSSGEEGGNKPPVIPPTPPVAPESPAPKEKSPQQKTIDMLEKKYEEDKNLVLKDPNGYHTTSQDYFVLVNNVPTRMSRMHNVMPESYVHVKEQEFIESYYNDLLKKNTYEEVESTITGSYKDNEDARVYLQYLRDNKNAFFDNPTPEGTIEKNITLRHIVQALSKTEKGVSSAIRMGNVADELYRNFFGTPTLYTQTSTENGIASLFNSINESEGKTYAQLFNDYETFKNLIQKLRKQYEYYTKTLKWELRALPFTWRANFSDLGWVAGETDLIGVDENGDIHIIDFKTSRHTFYTKYTANLQLTQDYSNSLDILHEENFTNGKLDQKARNVLRSIKDDTGLKSITIEWEPNLNQAVIVNKDRPFTSLPNTSYGQVISAFEDYSNQQTGYARMIQLETGGTVASIEILPSYCNYDYEFRVIYSVELEPRLRLPRSKKMLDILDNVADTSAETIKAIRDSISERYEELLNKEDYLKDAIDDNAYDMLSTEGKLSISDFINAVHNISIPQEDDVVLLGSVLDEITDLLNSYPRVLNAAREDYVKQKAKEAELEEQRRKAEEREKKIQGEEPGQAVSTVRAENKRDSGGNTSHTNLYWKQVEADRDLELATSSPDFITKGDFSLYREGNEIYVDITHNGKTWKHIQVDTKYNGTFFPKGTALYNKIVSLEKEMKAGDRIVPIRSSMNRTPGAIKLAKDKNDKYTYLPIRDTDLFAGEDIYDIEFSSSYGSVGIVDNSNNAVTFNNSDTDRRPIYVWSRSKDVPAQGTLINIKHLYKEELGKYSNIPVAIDRVKFKDGDINFILQLLQNPDLLDKEYKVEINGSVYNTHATGRQLAYVMIPIVSDLSRLGNIRSIVIDQTNNNIIRIINREDLATNSNGMGTYDISTQQGLTGFINQLKSMSIAENHDMLLARLGDDNNPRLPFAGLRRFFIENNSQNNSIKSLRISDTLSFDLDDFKTVTSATNIKRSGLNGFAYYLKHNMLRTQYAGMGSCNVEIGDVEIESASAPSITPTGALEIPQIPTVPEIQTKVDASAIDGLFKRQDKKAKNKKKLSEEKARKHIREILGDNVPVEFEQDFLKVASGAAHVVGNCKSDCIILSQLAWDGVEYHEAFHRVFEMLLPERKRDAIYQKIAKRIGVDLYNEDGSENASAFRQCAEYAADHYMDHMNHHWNDIKIPFLTKIINKIHDWVSMFVHFRDRDLYRVFVEVNNGDYKDVLPWKRSVERYNRMYKELYAQIHGVDFEHIVNRPMYDKLKQTVVFCIIQGQNVDRSGRNIQNVGRHIDKETFKAGIDKMLAKGYDIIGQNSGNDITVGQLAMKEIYDKFDTESLRDDVANYISAISTDFIKIREDESNEDAQGDEVSVVNANIGEHTRSSYEFSRFDKTSSRVRFFFATVPDVVYGDPIEVIENGKKVIKKPIKMALNDLGLPQFVPVNTLFNEFLNYFHDVDSVDELLEKLQDLGKEDPLFNILHNSISKLYKTVYKVEGDRIVRNSDKEALISQIMNIVRSNKHSFDIARSKVINSQFGTYTITIQPSDTEYNAKFYPELWNQMLVNGGTPIVKIAANGTLQFNPNLKGASTAFEQASRMFDHGSELAKAENGAVYNDVGIKQWLNNATLNEPKPVYLKVKYNGRYYYCNNPKDAGQLEVVKEKIVEVLNMLGININNEEFNYMLRHKYGSADYTALTNMFNSTSINDSMTSFLAFLKNISSNGKLHDSVYISGRKTDIRNAYAKMAFIKELAKWKYQYRHAHDQLTVLATGNNKFYEISDNNYISDVTRFINKRSQEFEDIKSDVYNYFEDTENKNVLGETPVYGSLILEEITKNPDAFITLRNFIGFKTDKRGDQGSDYFEISKREDYVSKARILEEGGIIMPTLSDKKTWLYIDGIKLPGLDYADAVDKDGNPTPFNNLGDIFVISKDPVSQLDNMLSADPEVISRFISYAMTEYKSVLKADADLDQMEKDGTKSSEVDNFYNKEQGARFSSLIGVWDYDYAKAKDGSMQIVGESFHSFNNKNKSRKDNIREAETYFFSRSREDQERLIQRLLHKQFLREVKTCRKLGLIELIGNSTNMFENYNNVGLNAIAIESIYKSLVAKNGAPVDQVGINKYKSLATLIYIYDISNKAIMSGQEVERVFSGNPAFYKWKYDDEGNLIDRTVDELKRLGGLVSTGNNNFTELKDIPAKYLDADGRFTGEYVCAEVDNELIQSPQIEAIEERMRYGEIVTAAYLSREEDEISAFREKYDRIISTANRFGRSKLSPEDVEFLDEYNGRPDEGEQEIRERISREIDSTPLQVLEDSLDPITKSIALRKAKEATDSYKLKYKNGKIDDGIDVADGGAYISDTMAEMLLRMNGNYSSEIEKAFKILREEVRSTILEKQQAYKDVITEVIGSQKYTAFGRRKHPKTGVQIAYYNKMALFPMFQCMSTGRMQNIYNKMKRQGIDMLMVKSAVKVGGQYSKPINWDDYAQDGDESNPLNHVGGNINNPLKPTFDESFDFGTYKQKFIYLRKQLNTDPKEEWMMSMGTQMTKVLMTNLFDGRDYFMQDGRRLNGTQLRDEIMDVINKLSDRGLDNIKKRFFDKDGDGDYTINSDAKFSKEILKMLSSKDPDKNILDAVEIIKEEGKPSHMRLPLNAVSNSNWLESVLISSINKKVIDIETPGAAFIQRSVWAMEGSSLYERNKGNIVSDENMSPKINNGERLQMVNNEGSMDCVVSVDFIKKMLGGDFPRVPIKDKNRNVVWDLVPELDARGEAKKDANGKVIYAVRKDKDGKPMKDEKGNPVYKRRIRTREMTFSEIRNWLINRKIIGKEASANIVGYRIPTQAESSIHALRIVDILPVVNDTIILPAEFTKITGSDFDIDKLFLSAVRYKINRTEGEDGKYHQVVSDTFEEKEDAYYQNTLLRDYIGLLLDWTSAEDHKQRTTNFLHRSIDNDTELLKRIIKDIESGVSTTKEDPYGFYSLSTQTESKNDYITGKIGIGPFALNNNNHILTMMYHVRFKHIESSIMAALDLESLDNREDKDKESIMSWLSALINAHVDIAKDPYISRLNVGPFTYNLVNLLVRTGLGRKTFYFTSQPIMRALSEAYVNAGAMYMADPYSSKYTLQQEAIDKVAENWFKESGVTFEGKNAMQLIEAVKEGGDKNADLRTKINQKIASLFNTDLISDAKSKKLNIENQLFYYLAYLQFDKYANALSSLVTYSKIDTKKHGKSVTEQMVFEEGFYRVYDISRESNLFEPVGLTNMKDKSYIGTKTQNAISSVRDILGKQFIQSTPAFRGTMDVILKAIGREDSLSTPLVTKVANAMGAAIKSQFFVNEYVPRISDNKHFLHDLVSESEENLEFVVRSEGTSVSVKGSPNHDLSTYVNGPIRLTYAGADGKYYMINSTVTGYDRENNALTIAHKLPPMYGKARIKGGKNTIYDRLNRLQVAIKINPVYRNLLDTNGEPNNVLLQMLVPGKEVEYTGSSIVGEQPDTYETMKFVKFFNFVEDSGSTANYIIDAWDELLHYKNDNKDAENNIRRFARDLIVYGFITSGDRGGFTKIFKYAPVSWREESGYGDFIQRKLIEYSMGVQTDLDIQDVILNNWFDNDFVRKYNLKDKDDKPQFMKYTTKVNGVPYGFATILAAIKKDGEVYKASIDPETAPMFIKIPRRKDRESYDSQRRFTIYKLHKIAKNKTGVEYPVYVKVNPKGNQIGGGFLITEYGRNDGMSTPEYTINEDVLEKTYQAANVGDLVKSFAKSEPNFAAIIDGLNRAYNRNQEVVIQDYTGFKQEDNTAPDPGVPITSVDAQNIIDPETKINIYAGTGENADLSNFAERPFTFQGFNFRSVEQAFQYGKLQGLRNQLLFDGSKSSKLAAEKVNNLMEQIMNSETGSDARRLGKTKITTRSSSTRDLINWYFDYKWNEMSSRAMKMLMKDSFRQNPQALQRLLSTGNATLTHTQDKGKWGTEFPRLLMEVRGELRKEQQSSQNNKFDDSEFSDDAMKHCKS